MAGQTGRADCFELTFDANNTIRLNDAQDTEPVTPVDIDGATVTVEFLDEDGASIFGPVAMAEFPAPASNDYFVDVLVNAANGFAVGQRVTLSYDFDGGVDLDNVFNIVAIVCEG